MGCNDQLCYMISESASYYIVNLISCHLFENPIYLTSFMVHVFMDLRKCIPIKRNCCYTSTILSSVYPIQSIFMCDKFDFQRSLVSGNLKRIANKWSWKYSQNSAKSAIGRKFMQSDLEISNKYSIRWVDSSHTYNFWYFLAFILLLYSYYSYLQVEVFIVLIFNNTHDVVNFDSPWITFTGITK